MGGLEQVLAGRVYISNEKALRLKDLQSYAEYEKRRFFRQTIDHSATLLHLPADGDGQCLQFVVGHGHADAHLVPDGEGPVTQGKDLLFILDIGTRSVIGVAGRLEEGMLRVLCVESAVDTRS